MFDPGNEPEDIFAETDKVVPAAVAQGAQQPQIVATSFGPSRTPIILGVIAVLAIVGSAGWYFLMGPGAATSDVGDKMMIEDDLGDFGDGVVDDSGTPTDDTTELIVPVSCGTDIDCVITAVTSGGRAFGRITGPSVDFFGLMITTTNEMDVGEQVKGGVAYVSETLNQSIILGESQRAAVLAGGGTEADIAAQEAEANESAKAVIGTRMECVFSDRQDLVEVLKASKRGDTASDLLSAGSCDTTVPESIPESDPDPEPAPAPTPIIPIDAPDAVLNALDSDRDGLNDFREQELGTNPQSADTDSDGLSDFDEVEKYGTDPTNPDTDGDSYLDGDEVEGGYNPNGEGTL